MNGKKWALGFCVWALVLVAFAQFNFNDPAFVKTLGTTSATVFVPTNTTSTATNLSWWVADNITTTNASGKISNWVDYGVSPFPLTNGSVTSIQPTISNNFVNGHSAAYFDGSQYLRNAAYTNAQPSEYFVVMIAINPTNVANQTYFDGMNSAGTRNAAVQSSGTDNLFAGSNAFVPVVTTNKWIVTDWVFNLANSGLFTNNISVAGLKNPGTQGMGGFTLAASQTLSFTKMLVAEVVTFKGTLGTVDSAGVYSAAADRTAIYRYLTNKYGLSP